MLSTVFEHDRVVSSTQNNVSLSAGNNPGVLKNSSEQAESLFVAFRQFPQRTSISLRISRRQCTRPGEIGLQPVALAMGRTKSNWSLGMLNTITITDGAAWSIEF